jgi:hypothetical protein
LYLPEQVLVGVPLRIEIGDVVHVHET